MIRTKIGTVSLGGGVNELMADYAVITNALIKHLKKETGLNDDKIRKELTKWFELGFISEERVKDNGSKQ